MIRNMLKTARNREHKMGTLFHWHTDRILEVAIVTVSIHLSLKINISRGRYPPTSINRFLAAFRNSLTSRKLLNKKGAPHTPVFAIRVKMNGIGNEHRIRGIAEMNEYDQKHVENGLELGT